MKVNLKLWFSIFRMLLMLNPELLRQRLIMSAKTGNGMGDPTGRPSGRDPGSAHCRTEQALRAAIRMSNSFRNLEKTALLLTPDLKRGITRNLEPLILQSTPYTLKHE